ncbi:MAG: hypothetical protein KAI47_20505 [Deltaproteobacteria bacterium]|nr:hypothetical protein [Deltaproteobacteria bacterium]
MGTAWTQIGIAAMTYIKDLGLGTMFESPEKFVNHDGDPAGVNEGHHILYHLLAALEWLGYLYASSLFEGPSTTIVDLAKLRVEEPKLKAFSESVQQTLLHIPEDVTPVALALRLQALWATSWIGLATGAESLKDVSKNFLLAWIKDTNNTRRAPPILVANVFLAWARTESLALRKQMASYLTSQEAGAVETGDRETTDGNVHGENPQLQELSSVEADVRKSNEDVVMIYGGLLEGTMEPAKLGEFLERAKEGNEKLLRLLEALGRMS